MPDEPAAPPTATNAVKMQLEAQKHRRVADYLEAEGDLVGPRFERAEARRLEQEGELLLEPPGPVIVAANGEIAASTPAMQPFTDTVRRPDMLAIDASGERMRLADKANALTRVSNTRPTGDSFVGWAMTCSSASRAARSSRDMPAVFTRTASGARVFIAAASASAASRP